MEDTKTEFGKIFNKCIKPVLEVYEVFKEHFGEKNVDIQKLNSFETFWENNKDSLMEIIPLKKDFHVTEELAAKLQECSKLTIQNMDAEYLQYYDVERKLLQTYQPWILVHWDKVTVTNENDKSVEIQDLFARIKIDLNGYICGNPYFLRSTYTETQWKSNYMHSHIKYIMRDSPETWRDSCLGSGPIKDTILKLTSSMDLDWWRLFCLELDKYVHVESLDGTPYMYLEQIGSHNGERVINYTYSFVHKNFSDAISSVARRVLSTEEWSKFFKYVVTTTEFKFNYTGSYSLAITLPQFAIFISDKFIEWYNKTFTEDSQHSTAYLLDKEVLFAGVWYRNGLHVQMQNRTYYDFRKIEREHTSLLKFKRQMIGLKFINEHEDSEGSISHLLAPSIVGWLYCQIEKIVNNEKRTEYKRTTC